MPAWARQTAWQPLHNLGAVGQHGNFPATRVALALKRLECSKSQSFFRDVRRHEIVTGALAASAASTSSNRDFEGSPVRLGGTPEVSGVNADDEFSLRIIWQIKLDLLALISVWRIEPGAISRLLVETLAESKRAMTNRGERFRRFVRQKLCDHVGRLAEA
jgi:hypothetical protein